ncbi:MAG: glutathione S-transferase family protein [Pseudomonadota bacterium]
MTYALYGSLGSGAAMVELALAEIGADYEFVKTRLGKGAGSAGAYRAVNPTGKLPALVTPEGEIYTVSAAILLTLADRHPSAGHVPRRNAAARAKAVRWTVFVASEIYPMIEIVDYPGRFADQSAAATLKERALARIKGRWETVEAAIDGNPWLHTRGPTIADLAIANVSRWSTGKRWRKKHCPRIEAMANALAQRESTRAVWVRHFA